jgi:hypothetical protein
MNGGLRFGGSGPRIASDMRSFYGYWWFTDGARPA